MKNCHDIEVLAAVVDSRWFSIKWPRGLGRLYTAVCASIPIYKTLGTRPRDILVDMYIFISPRSYLVQRTCHHRPPAAPIINRHRPPLLRFLPFRSLPLLPSLFSPLVLLPLFCPVLLPLLPPTPFQPLLLISFPLSSLGPEPV